MQTTIGIVICLIVIIVFSISYMNISEGLTTAPATTATTRTSPTGEIPLTTVVENAEKAATAKETTIGLSQNKNDYAEQINHLLDYYDNRTIFDIANAKQDKNGDYDLSSIVKYKDIKDALIQSLEYINGY
jgi:5-hydroxyisourate hydrolase-like protein (transthyretin family)